MDLEKVIKIAEKYAVDYIRVFYETLTQPSKKFRSIPFSTDPNRHSLQITDGSFGDVWFNTGLIIFVIISILLGSVLNSVVLDRKYSPDILNSAILTFIFWLFFSLFTHALCRLFRGKASFDKTLWVSLHVFATLFVVSSFANIVGGVIVKLPAISSYLVSSGKLGDPVANNPFYICFLVQFALMIVYLPIAAKNIHNLGRGRSVMVVAILCCFWVLFGIGLNSNLGIHYYFRHIV